MFCFDQAKENIQALPAGILSSSFFYFLFWVNVLSENYLLLWGLNAFPTIHHKEATSLIQNPVIASPCYPVLSICTRSVARDELSLQGQPFSSIVVDLDTKIRVRDNFCPNGNGIYDFLFPNSKDKTFSEGTLRRPWISNLYMRR